MDTPMITLKHIVKSFSGREATVHAVRDVSLTIERGSIYGIVGFSGAGKSTLVRCINLLERPTSGRVFVDGTELTALHGRALSEQRKKIGMIFQQFNLFATRTVFENVAFPLRYTGLSGQQIRQQVTALLRYVDLSDKESAYPSQMNAFQHHAYFNNDTSTNGYDLTVIADTFVITMNLYSSKYATYEELLAAAEAGEELTVVVPNDATNCGRALILLRDAGLTELSEYEGTPNVENILSQKVKLEEVNASMTYQYLDDAAACAVNGNYAASYGVDPASAIFDETVDLTNEAFICLIAVRTEDADNEVYNRIAEVFCSDVTSKVIHEKFDGFFSLIWEQEAAK